MIFLDPPIRHLDAPLFRVAERAERRARRMFWRNFAFAAATSTAWVACVLAARAGGALVPGWVAAVLPIVAILHLFLALPVQAGIFALVVAEEARGRGDAEGHHLHLLTVPSLPRPLYFHYWRSALLPVGPDALAAIATTSAFWWFIWPVAAAYVWQQAAAALGWQAPAATIPPPRPMAWWVVLLSFLYLPFFALPATLLMRGALSLATGAIGNLGDLAPLAMARNVDAAGWSLVESRVELDEAWEAPAGGGAASYAFALLKRGLAAAMTVVVYGGLAFAAIFGAFFLLFMLEAMGEAAFAAARLLFFPALIWFGWLAAKWGKKFAAWLRRKAER